MNQPVTATDVADALRERRGQEQQEAVIAGKQARVFEEVVIQQVADTVRHTEIDVAQTGGADRN